MPDMKKFILFIGAACLMAAADAQPITTPQLSPTQTLKQNFGVSSIELSYSRPSLKGRKLYVDLAPAGKIWRTGANQATTVTFGDTVFIGGKKIAPAKYGLVTIPDAAEWTVILTKQLDATSPEAYKQENDVVRVKVQPYTLPMSIETFTISIDDIKSNSCVIGLLWGTAYVGLHVTNDIDKVVMRQIDNIMNKDNKPYYNAAQYYFDNGKDLNTALVWVSKAADASPSSQPWVHTLKTRILAKMGKKTEATAAAKNAIQIAKNTNNPDYVKQNEDILKTL
jgi:Protein of unknown function (DUF2911)